MRSAGLPRRSRRTAFVVALGAATAITGVACAELGTGVGNVSYIAFDGIPFPAVIAGDSMRDSLGNAAPLRASAYDADGDEIVDAPFRYLTIDTGVVVDSAGAFTVTGRRDGVVRVFATLGGLQTDDRSIRVTRRPDSVYATSATAISFNYAVPDGATNVAPEMKLSLVSYDTVGVSPGVGGWLVRWRTVHGGDTLATTDTTLAALQNATGRRTATDTTAADGTSARRLRVFAARLPQPVDSFIVLAEIRRHGTAVAGSPVRFVVTVSPPAP